MDSDSDSGSDYSFRVLKILTKMKTILDFKMKIGEFW